jgi:hypothetical protein
VLQSILQYWNGRVLAVPTGPGKESAPGALDPLTLFPKNRAAASALAQVEMHYPVAGKSKRIIFQDRQRLATGAGAFPGQASAKDPLPGQQSANAIQAAALSKKVAQLTPADIERGLEAQPFARPDYGVRRSITGDFNGTQFAGHDRPSR